MVRPFRMRGCSLGCTSRLDRRNDGAPLRTAGDSHSYRPEPWPSTPTAAPQPPQLKSENAPVEIIGGGSLNWANALLFPSVEERAYRPRVI